MTNLPENVLADAGPGPVRLVLLDGVELRDSAGVEVSPVLAQPKRLALLAYLATSPANRLRRRDAIIGLLWPEMQEAQARHALNRSISFLRGWLGNQVIVSRGKEEVGVSAEALWCDVAAFEAALATGNKAAAMQFYARDFLDGFYLARAPDLEDWIHRERERLRRRACTAAWELATEAEAAGRVDVALTRARQAFELDLLDEPALRRLLAQLDRAGDRLGAARVYADFVRLLDRDFEMEPSPETRALMEVVRSRVRAYTTPSAAIMLPSRTLPVAAVPLAPPAEVRPDAEPPRSEAARGRPWTARSRLVASLAGIAFVIVAGLGALLAVSRGNRQSAPRAAGNTVLVLPFTHSGSKDVDILKDGAVEILSTNMMTPGVVATVDPRAVRAYLEGHVVDLTSGDALAAAARHFQARYIVVGGVAELRGQLRLNAALLDMKAAGAHVTDVDARGASTSAFDLFDELSRQLLGSLPGANPVAAARSTSSLRALRAYLQGELLYLRGRFAESLDAYQLAMREDSTFAIAAYRFNVTGDWTGTVPELVLDEALSRALRHSERLPEPERMLIEARAAAKRFELDRAEALYLRVLRGQPDNLEAWYQLGDLRFHWGSPLGRSYRLSRDAFERVRNFDPNDGPALIHLVRIAAADGNRAGLDTLIRQLAGLEPDVRIAGEAELMAAITLGDGATRQRALDATVAHGAQPSYDGARLIAGYTRDLASAARLAAAYAELGPPGGWRREDALALQAMIELGRGRPVAARRLLPPSTPIAIEMRALSLALPWIVPDPAELRQVRRDLVGIRRDTTRFVSDYVPRRVLLEGLLAIRAGDSAGTRGAIDMLRDTHSVPPPFNGYAHYFANVLAAAALQSQDRAADALAVLGPPSAVERSIPTPTSYSFSYARFLRATLLEQAGQLEDAASWFATFPEPEGSDVPFRTAAYMAHARIESRLGRKDVAAADQAAARALWRDAEPGMVQVLAGPHSTRP